MTQTFLYPLGFPQIRRIRGYTARGTEWGAMREGQVPVPFLAFSQKFEPAVLPLFVEKRSSRGAFLN
jgi:hypothetical protein